ncbi:MAG: metallophosphoesterase [Treponema sp.]|nr:metallophosphoesterase [Treponema sp.]
MVSKRIIFLALLSLLVIFFSVSSCKTISVKNYSINAPLEKDSIIKIVLISDLHSTVFGINQNKLIEKVKEQNPDLIILSGDIFDDIVPHLGTELLLSGIKDLAPVYYVTGNHEYKSYDMQRIRELLGSYNVIILSDSYATININNNDIILAGIEDPDKKKYETPGYNQIASMENAFRELDDIKLYKILIAHRPENIENYKKFSFNLILSGHTHGGQVRIPLLLNGLYAPNQGLFPKYSGGLYKHEKSIHIISRGLSINPKLPRIFNPPELVVIILKPMELSR